MGTTKIFWSWQSDRPARETRDIIREAITRAIATIAAEVADADRPDIDHGTDGVAGSPDIVATILGKIEAAAVFIADVTPIAVGETDAQGNRGKQVANPNVLIELGYATRAIGRRVLPPRPTATHALSSKIGVRPRSAPASQRSLHNPHRRRYGNRISRTSRAYGRKAAVRSRSIVGRRDQRRSVWTCCRACVARWPA